jgi:hypothetical protein
MLATIYAWFTEGHDTPDLQEADTLLQRWRERWFRGFVPLQGWVGPGAI